MIIELAPQKKRVNWKTALHVLFCTHFIKKVR
nr:MAG TPA: hypothetical protein [Caudoviricetes sp.]